MAKISFLSLIYLMFLYSSSALADMRNCAMRMRIIESKIEMAKQIGNPYRVAGLQHALRRVQIKCQGIGYIEPANLGREGTPRSE
ncbi:DUF1090 family protein [Burkholderia sp. AW33-5]